MLHSPNQWRGLRESKNKVHPLSKQQHNKAHKSFIDSINNSTTLPTIQNGQNKANRT